MASFVAAHRRATLLLFLLSCIALVLASTTSPTELATDDLTFLASSHKHNPPSSPSRHTKDQLRAEWSSIMGWVSIACWVIVYTPQMHQNYATKSAEGLSITFVVIWLAGDALNAAGALMQGLLWTMVILALYYCGCDCVLIFQYWYYSKYYHRGVPISTLSAQVEADERTPLIADGAVVEDDLSHNGKDDDADTASWQREVGMYAVALLLVVATGVAAWWVAEKSDWSGNDGGSSKHGHFDGAAGSGQKHGGGTEVGWRWDAQFYGWLSAVLYLSSRIPQILKNRTTKCEGLSLALFVFAVAGNGTYVASILLQSSDSEYLLESLSWLVGSVGTILLDFIVLGQFIAYRKARKEIHRLRRASVSAQAAASSPER